MRGQPAWHCGQMSGRYRWGSGISSRYCWMEPRNGCRICTRDLPPGAGTPEILSAGGLHRPPGFNLRNPITNTPMLHRARIDTPIPARFTRPSHSSQEISYDHFRSRKTQLEKSEIWRGRKTPGVTPWLLSVGCCIRPRSSGECNKNNSCKKGAFTHSILLRTLFQSCIWRPGTTYSLCTLSGPLDC